MKQLNFLKSIYTQYKYEMKLRLLKMYIKYNEFPDNNENVELIEIINTYIPLHNDNIRTYMKSTKTHKT